MAEILRRRTRASLTSPGIAMHAWLPYHYRQTKIIYTAGPATESEEVIEALIRNGADMCRLNMAHGSHDWVRMMVRRVREVGQRVSRHVSVMMDVKGPEIRTGDVPETLELETGELFDFYVEKRPPELDPAQVRGVAVNYPGLNGDLKAGDTVLVDNGLLRLAVLETLPDRVRCQVQIGGPLKSRRHINLPGVHVKLPSLTRKDYADLEVALEMDIDWIALSFVRDPEDVGQLREFLRKYNSTARIIAKVEDQSALTNLADIVRVSDGVMVARGDLGIEIPFEKLPVVQRQIVRQCLDEGKLVIVATHMLESMISAPVPTRAEITDVANAVLELADCVMLSGETTTGKYPVACVQTLNRIISQVESQAGRGHNQQLKLRTAKAKVCRAAVVLAEDLDEAAIVVFTRHGYLAQVLSSLRPSKSPIYAFTDQDTTFRRLVPYWGIEPFLMQFDPDPEKTIAEAVRRLRERGWVRPGDPLVVLTNMLAGAGLTVDTIQLRQVD